MNNSWNCDCILKDFRNFVMKRKLSPSSITCYEPERLSDKTWTEVSSDDFACKPSVRILRRHLLVNDGWNATIHCQITGSPVPAVKWVLDGRIIANLSSSPHSNVLDQKYVIKEVATKEGRICSGLEVLSFQNVTLFGGET